MNERIGWIKEMNEWIECLNELNGSMKVMD
jgi:hypothetical protein